MSMRKESKLKHKTKKAHFELKNPVRGGNL